MIAGAAVNKGMGAAGVVAKHSTNAAPVAGGGLRTEEKSVRLKFLVEFVPDYARLHPRGALFCINFDYPVPGLDIDNDAAPYNLAGNRSPRSPGYNKCLPPAGFCQEGDDITFACRVCYASGYLTINRRISGIGPAVQGVGKNKIVFSSGLQYYLKKETTVSIILS